MARGLDEFYKPDGSIDLDAMIIRHLTRALDDLCVSCAGGAPDKKVLMRARAFLPAWCKATLINARSLPAPPSET